MRSVPVLLVAGSLVAAWAALDPDSQPVSDGELMQQVATGDREAFATLYDRHARPVYSLLARMLRDHGGAEDLTQEVFFTLWQQAAQFDLQARSALPWLLVIARNRALDRLRSATARHEQTSDDATLETAAAAMRPDQVAIESRIWEQQAMQRIRSLLSHLSPDERRVIELAYFDGLTQAAISQRTGAPLGTVKSWTRTGLAKLRAAL